jgi:hypothetical protein
MCTFLFLFFLFLFSGTPSPLDTATGKKKAYFHEQNKHVE